MMNVWSPLFQNCIFRILIENVHTNNVIDYWGLLDLFLYTETFTFSFGHYCLDSWSVNMWPRFSSKWGQTRPADDDPRCHRLPSFNHGDLGQGIHEQFRVFPFFFNSFYQVGTVVCRTCGCHVHNNTWWGGSPGEGSLGTPIWLIYLFQIKKTQFFWESLKIATNFLGITNLGDFSWHWID